MSPRLTVSLETFEDGRRVFHSYGGDLPPGTLARRVEIRVEGDLLASIPFYDPAEDIPDDDEDEDDPDDYCHAMNTARGDGVEYQCEQSPGHDGSHSALHGWLRW